MISRSFGTVTRFYKKLYVPTLAESTAREYTRIIDTILMPAFERKGINTVTAMDIQELRATVKSPSVANKMLTVLSSIFTWAEDNEMRNPNLVNPASKVKRYKSLPKERYLSQDEIETVLLSLPYGTFGDVVKLLILTGARKSEIEGMEWEWVDWERKVVRLPDSKTGAGRVIYLNKPALDVLRERKPLYGAKGYVFPMGTGHYVSTTQEWFRFRRQIGMADVRLHDLRHTFASQAVNSGHSLAVIGKLLGHSTTKTTERYAHLDVGTLVDAANDIGRGMYD